MIGDYTIFLSNATSLFSFVNTLEVVSNKMSSPRARLQYLMIKDRAVSYSKYGLDVRIPIWEEALSIVDDVLESKFSNISLDDHLTNQQLKSKKHEITFSGSNGKKIRCICIVRIYTTIRTESRRDQNHSTVKKHITKFKK